MLLLLAAGVAISARGAFSTRIEPVAPRAVGPCSIHSATFQVMVFAAQYGIRSTVGKTV